MTCKTKTEWGPCQQPTRGRCPYHKRMLQPGFRADPFYHKKVALGLVDPVESYVTHVELDTLFRGRPRNDGRRLDAWVR